MTLPVYTKFHVIQRSVMTLPVYTRLSIVCKHLARICWCFLYYSIMLWEGPSYWFDGARGGGVVMGESRERSSSRFHPIRSVQRSCRKLEPFRLIQREAADLTVSDWLREMQLWCFWLPSAAISHNMLQWTVISQSYNVYLLFGIYFRELFTPSHCTVFSHSWLDAPYNYQVFLTI
jgi:hypothetical protein